VSGFPQARFPLTPPLRKRGKAAQLHASGDTGRRNGRTAAIRITVPPDTIHFTHSINHTLSLCTLCAFSGVGLSMNGR
jgi:hypothetical protein